MAAATALVVAGCFQSAAPSGSPSVEPSTSLPPLESLPPSTVSDPPSVAPSPSPSEPEPSASLASEPPSSAPTVSPSSIDGAVGVATDCTGNEQNQDFFADLAVAVEWDVYCAVLPEGWFVDTGSFRLANGGWMVISYNGPAGARLELSEGAFCDSASGCLPDGSETGSGSFGDREGVVYAGDDGSWAIAVDAGAAVSWQLVGTGVDEEAFLEFGGSLLRIG